MVTGARGKEEAMSPDITSLRTKQPMDAVLGSGEAIPVLVTFAAAPVPAGGLVSRLRQHREQPELSSVPKVETPRWLTLEQAALRAGYSTKTLVRAMEACELSGKKVRNRWRLDPRDVDAWLTRDVPVAVRRRPRSARTSSSAKRGFLTSRIADDARTAR
jgi:excisionase family DNA binding protein